MKLSKNLMILIFISLSLSQGFAETPLDRMFKSLGSDVNLSTPGAFQDQAAGYYTGGGLYMRNKREGFNLFQFSPPRFGASCNAMDMYFGSFSFMKGEQLIRVGRSLLTQAPIHAFKLAMKTMVPQIANSLSEELAALQKMSALSLESCQMTEQLFAAALPKGSAFQAAACEDVKRQGGEDWFGAREKCKKPQDVQNAVEERRKIDKDLMAGEYNLVWHALQKMEGMSENKALAEFIMSVCGTLISKKEGDRYRIQTIQGKGDTKGFLTAHLKGGTTEVLTCADKEKCLNPTWTKTTIEDKDHEKEGSMTMRAKVQKKTIEIKNKYLNKGKLSAADLMFLNDTVKLPIYRYIQVSAATGSEFLLSDALEYIAISILLNQFNKMSARVLEAIESLQAVQLEDAQIEKFKKNLQRTRSRLQILAMNANEGGIYRLNKMIKTYEDLVSIERGLT